MGTNEKMIMLNPLRYAASVLIATGGSMHAIGLIKGVIENHHFPVWYWMIFLIAIPGYLISSVLIIKNFRAGYYFAMISPIIGGLLILPGFFFPSTGLLILIPGTYGNEITLIGFITLISEPVASTSAAFLIKHEIWNLTSKE